jgi:hypothetical protein
VGGDIEILDVHATCGERLRNCRKLAGLVWREDVELFHSATIPPHDERIAKPRLPTRKRSFPKQPGVL